MKQQTQTRKVHRELAQLVETEGSEAPRRLFDVYRKHNAAHFAGKLGEPFVMALVPSSPRALGDYCGRDEHGITSRIRIRPNVLRSGNAYADDVLLHEMIHAWCVEVRHDDEPGYKGHGPEFAAKCNAIGETMGLPKVFPKGRGGPDCARWPLNVRPFGYYEQDAPKTPETEQEEGEEGTNKGKAKNKDESITAALMRTVERWARKHPEMSLDDIAQTILDDIAQAMTELGAAMAEREDQ